MSLSLMGMDGCSYKGMTGIFTAVPKKSAWSVLAKHQLVQMLRYITKQPDVFY